MMSELNASMNNIKNIRIEFTGDCSRCDKAPEECTKEEISICLGKSECEYCGSMYYHYPYGRDESRHCCSCGAEWSVYK